MRNKCLLSILLSLCFMTMSCSDEEPADLPLPPTEEVTMPQSCASDTLRLLFIGNSFARDVVESYLPKMLKAEGVTFRIGRLSVGSCSLEMHLDNAINNNPVYDYWVFDNDGPATERVMDMTLDQALRSELWTHVSFQQASGYSGIYSSYPLVLDSLIRFVMDRTCYDTDRFFYQTWAYGPDYSGKTFKNYKYDQQLMYSSIVDVSKRIMSEYAFSALVPAGTAIQNARNTSLGNDLTQDGLHLANGAGRFTACATWCEVLTGNDARDNSFSIPELTDEEQRLARECAHAAVLSPFSVSVVN